MSKITQAVRTLFLFITILFSLAAQINLINAVELNADVAYVIKSSSGVDNTLLNYLNDFGFSHDTIYENNIQNTNFSKYRLIIIGDSNFGNINAIPYDHYRTLVINSFNYVSDLGWSRDSISRTSPSRLDVKNRESSIVSGLPESFYAYSTSLPIVKSFHLKGQKPAGIGIIVSSSSGSADAAVATLGPGRSLLNGRTLRERNIFFGLTKSAYWTEESEKLFYNSLKWLAEDEDLDFDGFTSDVDCDDLDDTVYPGADEVPYDGIDQDCSGEDLADLDGDGYDSDLVGGEDCDDSDEEINPENPSPELNCINDQPIIDSIETSKEVYQENDLVRITVEAYDPDGDILSYSIDDSRFVATGNTFRWQTNYDDEGFYRFTLTVSDEDYDVSEDIEIEIVEMNAPPVMDGLNCELTVIEDEKYSCNLSASDLEGDTFHFGILDENDLNCNVDGNQLEYYTYEDHNGDASCTISVSDRFGYTSKDLEVVITPVNDPPVILSSLPEGTVVKAIENVPRVFSLDVEDPDSNVDIQWFINNELTSNDGLDYSFSKANGFYLIMAKVSDEEFEASRIWSVIVGKTSEFTCSEVGGFLLTENKVCNSGFIDVKDTKLCCTSPGVPAFKDADTCDAISNKIVLDIVQPDKDSNLELGEKIEIELRIKNDLDEDQDFDVSAYLYNLDQDTSEKEVEGNIEIQSKRTKNIKLVLPATTDLDLEDNFAIFFRVEGDECNQNYSDIDFLRPSDKIVLTDFIVPNTAICGKTVTVELKLENIGKNENEVILALKNELLGLDQVKELSLEKYNQDGGKSEDEFTFTIPDDVESGSYDLRASITYNLQVERYSKSIEIRCTQDNDGNDDSGLVTDEETLFINSLDNETSLGSSIGLKELASDNYYIILLLVFNIAALGLITLYHHKKKTIVVKKKVTRNRISIKKVKVKK